MFPGIVCISPNLGPQIHMRSYTLLFEDMFSARTGLRTKCFDTFYLGCIFLIIYLHCLLTQRTHNYTRKYQWAVRFL